MGSATVYWQSWSLFKERIINITGCAIRGKIISDRVMWHRQGWTDSYWKFVIFQQQRILESFIPYIAQQFACDYNFSFSREHQTLFLYWYILMLWNVHETNRSSLNSLCFADYRTKRSLSGYWETVKTKSWVLNAVPGMGSNERFWFFLNTNAITESAYWSDSNRFLINFLCGKEREVGLHRFPAPTQLFY